MRWAIGLGIIAATVVIALQTRKGREVAKRLAEGADELRVRARKQAYQKAGEWRRSAETLYDRAVGE